jgi:hypothetical protein
MLALGILAPIFAKSDPPGTHPVIDIERTIEAGQYGVAHVSDKFTILNNGTNTISYLDVGIPRQNLDDLYWAQATDSKSNTLTIEADVNKTSDIYWMRVHFNRDVPFNNTYVFTLTSALGGIITSVTAGFQYNFTAAPILAVDARIANVTYLAPQGTTFIVPGNSTYVTSTQGGFPSLTNVYKPWKAYSTTTFYAPYGTVNQYIMHLNSLERDIIIGSSGALSVSESYSIYNPSVTISTLTLTLPDGSYNIMAYDLVGALWATPQNPTAAPYQVQVTPRYTAGIRPAETFNFTLTYDVPQSEYLKQLNWWGSYNLTFPLLDNKDDYLYGNATVKIIVPDGISVTNLNLPQQSPVSPPIQVSPDERTFTLKGITNQNPMSFGLTFNFVPFWSAFEALPWIAGFEVLIIAAGLAVRLRRGPGLEVPVPVEKLREFVGLYDERLALTRELVMMEEEVSRGGLVKHEFRRRRKVMELRLDEINKSLMSVKADLRETSPRHEELMRRIDRAEAEIEASRASLNQVKGQYRAGKTTRETYDTMLNDISKRIDRAEETLETTLITLREEAR